MDIETAYRLGRLAVCHPLEGNVMAPVGPSDRPDPKRAVGDENGGTGLEVLEICLIDVEAEEPVQPVGTAQPPDPESRISRGIRLQL